MINTQGTIEPLKAQFQAVMSQHANKLATVTASVTAGLSTIDQVIQ
jgi:hypothetical protein